MQRPTCYYQRSTRRLAFKFMKALLLLANAFINTFGITQPTEAAAKRASQFIAVLIGLVILLFLGVAAIGIYVLMRH